MLVYAHPDDEILFAGGLMLAHPMWDWTLVCVTDPGRAEQQDKALDLLREEGVNIVEHTNLGFTDGFSPQPGYRSLIFRNVEATYQACEPHIVFTHGYRGEYGHHHHHWTHLAVHLACDNVWDFLHPNSRVKQLRKTLVREVPTDKRKNDIFRLAYGEVAAGLLANAPWITGPLLRGEPEYFTQGVVGL
jgi:LmbE family N-acetylglucosaminyl deacetylase